MHVVFLLLSCIVLSNASFRNYFHKDNAAPQNLPPRDPEELARMFPNTNISAVREKLAKHREKWAKKLKLDTNAEAELGRRLLQYRAKPRDRVREEGDTLYEVNKNANLSDLLYQGDIVLTEDQAASLTGIDNTGPVNNKTKKKKRTRRQAYRDSYYPSTTWGNMVYYYFDYSASDTVQSVFRKAVAFWQNMTCIDFQENALAPNRIRVFKGQGCYSYIGMVRGVQDLSLGSGCESVGTAAHELGHALGFFHTQSRWDRDSYISVNLNNIDPSYVDQFDKESTRTNYNYGMPYDYGSIMQYGGLSASRNSQPTMVAKDIKSQDTMGSDIVAFYDVSMMNEHYKCKAKCPSISSAQCQNGGYPNPRNCAICNCPSGYGGALCDQRPPGCGSELTAQSTPQILRDVVGLGSPRALEEFTFCNYWIRAPEGKRIQIKLKSFQGFYSDGCPYGGVEIKTQRDQNLTGYRYCSNSDVDTSIISFTNLVPILTFNRISQSTVELEYQIADDSAIATEFNVSVATQVPPTPCRDQTRDCVILKWFGYCQMKNVRQKCRASCESC